VGPRLFDVPAFEIEDLAGVPDGRKPVGDDEGGPPFHQGVHRFLDVEFVPRIHRGDGFVEDEHRGVLGHGPGYGEKLLLTGGRMKKFISRRLFGINKRSFRYEMDKKSVLSQCAFWRKFEKRPSTR
jgi:hypothetical protein